ncbi:helix-turn-helix transcriptional regulator [Nocardia asteroides]|uniref:helix-turn-helix transcriptional regulator n=1 Tax=Nocardia asteroides TaxID=1824 RepID=UPI003F557956
MSTGDVVVPIEDRREHPLRGIDRGLSPNDMPVPSEPRTDRAIDHPRTDLGTNSPGPPLLLGSGSVADEHLVVTSMVELARVASGFDFSEHRMTDAGQATGGFVIAVVGRRPAAASTAFQAYSLTLFDTAYHGGPEHDEPRPLLTLRVRRSVVASHTRLGSRLFGATSIRVPMPAAEVVAQFLEKIAELARLGLPSAPVLADHTPSLLGKAIDVTAGRLPRQASSELAVSAQVSSYLHANYRNSSLTIDDIARFFSISRRTLFRVMGQGGISGRLRELRVDHARHTLKAYPEKTIAEIADEAGFKDERAFYRAFGKVEFMTPSEYRSATPRAVHNPIRAD